MNSKYQAVEEEKIISLIRNAGGKLPLSDLLMYYKKTFNYVPFVPPSVKLSVWIKQFKSIKVHLNRKNNQTYVLEDKHLGNKRSCQTVDKNQVRFMEQKILHVLKKNGNRVSLDNFVHHYHHEFNQDLLVPVGMKLPKWFQQFSSIELDHDTHLNQTFIVARSDGSLSDGSVVGNVMKVIKDDGGCVRLSGLVELYRKKYSEDLLLPVGKKLSHWLCEHNNFVLTEHPSDKNEVYVCIKHPVQRAIDESKQQENRQGKDKSSSSNSPEKDAVMTEPSSNHASTGLWKGVNIINEFQNVHMDTNKSLPQYYERSNKNVDFMVKSWQVVDADQKESAIASATRRLGCSLSLNEIRSKDDDSSDGDY